MISREGVKYSLKNLKKNKGRSFLTIFSILVGIATIFIFISFGLGLYDYIDELSTSSSADKVLIMAKTAGGVADLSTSVVLNQSDIDSVSKTPGVYDATGLYFNAVQIKQNSDIKFVFLISYDPKKDMVLDSFNVGAKEGRILSPGDDGKILLGYNYLIPNKIFPKPFKVNDKIEVNGQDLRIIGFLEEIGNPQDDSQIYVTNDYYEELFPEENSYIQIFARVDLDNIQRVVDDIEKSLRKSRDVEEGKEDFTVQSFDELIEQFSGALNVIVGFIVLIALISVLVSTINTANTMITSVLERYKEIGILKAVGAKNIEIFDIFLFESSFLGVVAGVLGCALGWGISSIGGLILKDLGWSFLQPHFSIYLFVGLIAFAGITGAISGALPARRAAKTNPVDALRSE